MLSLRWSRRDEEGGEHLRKRSMHLPFTFATGEAMLYQTCFPLHGFSDALQGKAKGGKAKKGKLDKTAPDDLDPKSLLGALMSQDESVYVCQPDTEPRMSYHSSIFSQQQGGGEYSSLLADNSLHAISNGDSGSSNKTASYDPLLATLDSLSLDGEETCSNSELFNALENLGLNAEDLELLLLDERMIQVELDPNHIPSLSDLLTNNEILSYLHDALENRTDGKKQGDAGGVGVNTDSTQSIGQHPQACLTSATPPAPPSSRQPIVQLSQQMQQHISAGELLKAPPGTAADAKVLSGIPNGLWVETENRHLFSHHTHQQPHAVLKSSQLNGELKQHNSLLQSSQQWHLQQDQSPLVHFSAHQQVSSQGSVLPSFQNQLTLTTNQSYIPNGHAAFPPSVEADLQTPHAGVTGTDSHHYQSYQQQPHSSTAELEQLLGLSQQQRSLPPLEAYGMFHAGAPDSAHGKVRSN